MTHMEGVSGCIVGGFGHSTSHNPGIHSFSHRTLAIYFHTFKTALLLAKLLLERKGWSVYRSPFS